MKFRRNDIVEVVKNSERGQVMFSVYNEKTKLTEYALLCDYDKFLSCGVWSHWSTIKIISEDKLKFVRRTKSERIAIIYLRTWYIPDKKNKGEFRFQVGTRKKFLCNTESIFIANLVCNAWNTNYGVINNHSKWAEYLVL